MSVTPVTDGRSRRGPRLTGLLLASALAAVAVVFGGGVASAHAYLRGSDPADGATVPGLPATVSLDFNETIHNFEPVVVVTGPDGKNHATGEIQVVGNVVSTAVSPDGPAGSYAVAYRVVSADGHPVTGELHFTVTATASSSRSSTSSTPASPAASSSPLTSSSTSASSSTAGGGVASRPTSSSAGTSTSSTGSPSSTGAPSTTSSSTNGASSSPASSSASTAATTSDPGSSTPVDQAAGAPATSSGPDWWIWLAIAVAAVILIVAGVITLRRPHED